MCSTLYSKHNLTYFGSSLRFTPYFCKRFKLAFCIDNRYLSSEESQFVDLVTADLEEFQAQFLDEVVLLFPPVNSYLRLLIHKTVEDFPDLHSFSVGEGEQRQTVVCWARSLINGDQDTSFAPDYLRPQGMRGRGRARFKDRNSPSPGPGNRYASGDDVDRWSHDRYSSEPGANRQASPYDDREAMQGTRQQRSRLPCQQSSDRSSPVIRQVKNEEQRTSSPAGGECDSSSRVRKSERSKNRRPDVQVYVPRARRQQPGQNTSENQASPDRPDVTPKVTPVRQRKKEVEHYVPRGRREQQNRERDSAFQVTNPSTIEVPHTNSMNTEPAKNIHKKIKVTDNVPDERYQTDIKSVSISEQSVYKNEERCAENKFCDNEDVVQRSNSSKTDMESSKYDVLDNSKNVPTHTSIYEPAAIGTSKCKKLDANNEEVIVENTQHLPELSTEQKFDKVTDTDLEDVTSLRSASADLTLHHTIGTTNVSSKESALDKLPESQEDHSASHKHCGEQTASKNNVNCNNKTTVQESQILSDDFNDKTEVPESTSDIIGYNVSKMSSLDGAGEMELSCEIENMKDDQDGNYSHGDELTNLESEDFAKCSNDSTTLPEETDQAQKVTSQTEKYSEVTSNADNPELNSTSLVKSSENVTKSLTADNVLDVQAESNFNDTSETSSEDKATTEIAPGVLPDSNETNAKSNCDQTNEESEILRDQTDIIENSMDTEAMDTRQSCGGQESGDFEDKDISENKVEQSAHTHSSKSVQEAVREDAESENVTIYNNKSEGMEAKTSDQPETVTIDSSQSKEEEEDEDSWDKMFDDDGECLDPTAMEELTKTVGKVKIQKSKKINYLDYQPKDKSNFDFTQYEHIIEIYDFPVEFVTRDLIIAFQSFMSRGFDLKWVDDTHALGIFSSAIAAKDALQLVHPLLKVCPLSQASKQSQNKAKRCTEFLQPYKPRPETSAMAARRLVAGALGIATGVSREKREMERKQLKEAKAKKRQERQNRENIWEYGKCAMDEES